MPLKLDFAAHEDAERIAEIHMAAFASNAMLLAQYPTATVREGLQRCVKAKALADIDDTKTTVLVVRDSVQRHPGIEQASKHSVIAFAKWAHPIAQDEDYKEPSWVWPEGTNWQMLEKWSKRTEEAQAKAIGSTPCYRLHFIGTDPQYQGRGAGSMMLKWGIERCQKDNVPAYVESTMEAGNFYSKYGFSAIETFSVETDGVDTDVAKKEVYEEISLIFRPLA